MFADLTSRMQNWKEVNVWSSTVYSCDFHEGRQHFITLLMFVLNFVLFFKGAGPPEVQTPPLTPTLN